MEQIINEVKLLDTLKTAYTVADPETIREKLAVWAFEEADNAARVITRLEEVNCAACYSPAPIYYQDMADEITKYWPEIDDALTCYRETIGETWTLKPDDSILNYLWFAYEWIASELVSEIRSTIE